MPGDEELQTRGRLVRSLGTLREMLPGSFIERRRKCGKPNCRCADGNNLHPQFQISLLLDGKLRTFNISAELAEEARRQVEMHQRFRRAGDAICQINLRRFLRRRQKKESTQG
ncbi:MAG: DUF6788 family protein [Terriglobia bacterium]